MTIEQSANHRQQRFQLSHLHYWLLLFLMVIPISCSAQENMLSRISSTERSDGQGHVLRFHMNEATSSINFAQPHPYLLQLELRGSNLDTTDIHIQDDSNVIDRVKYYQLGQGIGAEIFLNDDALYKASAYPDGGSQDILVGLTATNQKNIADHINPTAALSWSNTPVKQFPLGQEIEEDDTAAIDTTYQKIKDKIKFDVVVLDAGHGGTEDVGAIGHRGIYEKNVVLDITKKVGAYIKENLPGVKVVYTRDDDTFIELDERGPIANRAEGDLFVSIHANSAGARQAHGTETYFLGLERSKTALKVMERENQIIDPDGDKTKEKPSQEELIIYELANSGYIASSQELAGMVEQQFKERAQRRSRGVKQARFVVLYQASMPAILVETGFLTNPSEAQYLTSDYGQSIIASAIFRAIRNYKEQFEKSQHLNTN